MLDNKEGGNFHFLGEGILSYRDRLPNPHTTGLGIEERDRGRGMSIDGVDRLGTHPKGCKLLADKGLNSHF